MFLSGEINRKDQVSKRLENQNAKIDINENKQYL